VKLDSQNISVREITDYMFVPDSPIKADVTIVLGQTLWERPLNKAVELYKSGLSGYLIFTGGFNPKLGAEEAICMSNGWVQMGYPKTDLLIDQVANNTMENMVNSRAILESRGFLDKTARINIVTINFHMRRSIETFNHVFFDKTCHLGIVNYPSIYCHPQTWHADKKGRTLVMTEFRKIHQYLRNP